VELYFHSLVSILALCILSNMDNYTVCRSVCGVLVLVLKLSLSTEIYSTDVRLKLLSATLMQVKSSEMLHSADW
jgi:hypothetical protein